MRIGVAATPEVAIPTLEWLKGSNHEISLVITQPNRPSGRGQVLKQSAVGDWAQLNQIPVLKPETSSDLVHSISDLDVVITIGYGVILPEEILSLPRYGFLNLHFSLLPLYRGAAPVQRALQNGETTTGVTVFQLDKGMDTGPIYSQLETEIDSTWRSIELLNHLSRLGVKAVELALEMIESGVPPKAQSGEFSIASKITKSEAQLNFHEEAIMVVNSIRAFTLEPGAWTLWKGQPFKISKALIASSRTGAPGQIFCEGNKVFVACSEQTSIEVLEVTPSGKKPMQASDWARGAHLKAGDFFG